MVQRLVRYVGIDFGTSSSVVAFKDYYQNPSSPDTLMPIDSGDATPINEGDSPIVPTAVYRRPDGSFDFGCAALEDAEDAALEDAEDESRLRHRFKTDLVEVGDEHARAEGGELTKIFLKYLYDLYRQQARQVEEGQRVDEERTLVSFPAKWPDPVRRLMIAAAREADFPNVQGMAEPEAAMRYFAAVRSQEWDRLVGGHVIEAGKPLTVLLIDMGAGTTDLVLCTYVPGEGKLDVLYLWPPVDQFKGARRSAKDRDWNVSGGEMDHLLQKQVIEPILPESRRADPGLKLPVEIPRWKEKTVSRKLKHRELVDKPYPLISAIFPPANKPALKLDREQYEQMCSDYLKCYQGLITGLFTGLRQNAARSGQAKTAEDVDLVILTGGHSAWYWARDWLTGKAGDGQPLLPKIAREPERILQGTHPRESVARGMAMAGMPLKVTRVAANDAWLKIEVTGGGKFDSSKSSLFRFQQNGHKLPLEHTMHVKEFHLPPNKPGSDYLNGECTLIIGGRQEGNYVVGGKVFSRVGFFPHYPKAWGAIRRCVNDIFYKEMEDVGELFVKVDVSEGEEFVVRGFIDTGWVSADCVKYFAIENGVAREATGEEEAALRRVGNSA